MGTAKRRLVQRETAARFDWRSWSPAAALVIAVLLAFSPAFHAEFIRWDDPRYLNKNESLLRSSAGLKEIWTPLGGKLPQYYPLTFTSYWIEYQFWQLTPTGYHVTNVVLHAANTVLVLLLVSALGGSQWLAIGTAGVFALHPVQVESVMWVTERKNTLSGLFFLMAFLLYLQHRRTRRWTFYAAALATFVCALLSKTQTVSLPVILCLTEWSLQRSGRLRPMASRGVLVRVLPMLLLGLLSTWVTAAVERQMTATWAELPALPQRVLIAATAAWYYVASFLAPFDLPPIAPKWVVSAGDPRWWIGLLAWVVVIPLGLRWYARVPPLVLWGTGEFFIALAPGLGLFPFAYQHYSYVAMRFLYLSCIGGGVVLAALAERLAERLAGAQQALRRFAVAAGSVMVLGSYGLLTYWEARHWQTNFGFWQYALERDPDGYPPNMNLGFHYETRKEWSDASRFYQRGHELRPMDRFALRQYLRVLGMARGPQAVVDACEAELRQRGTVNASVVYLHRAMAYEQLGRRDDAIRDYERVQARTRRGSESWEAAQRSRARLSQATSP